MPMKNAALVAPDTTSERKFFEKHEVTCHMAAIYWAFRSNGKTAKDATRALKKITEALCAGCKTPGMNHGSLNPMGYARNFASKARAMDTLWMTSDVVVTPNPALPMHSMVIVDRSPGGNALIRGYNNRNTFPNAAPQPPFMAYDPTTRDLSTRASPMTNAAYYIKEYDYVRACLEALRKVENNIAL